mmetsp:Transcript_24547/g.46123  ORF Transcript_24547/g.46123 Transcript_24547/m.46123 type:complete len:178 (+) Transcript_24547:45-578(+)
MINQDITITPPTGSISTTQGTQGSLTGSQGSFTTSNLPPPPPSTLDCDDLNLSDNLTDNLSDDLSDEQPSSFSTVIPVEKLKNGASTAFSNLSWLTSTLSSKATEIKTSLETNPQYVQTTENISTKISELQDSDFGKAVERHSKTAFNGVVTLGENIGKGTVAAGEKVGNRKRKRHY